MVSTCWAVAVDVPGRLSPVLPCLSLATSLHVVLHLPCRPFLLMLPQHPSDLSSFLPTPVPVFYGNPGCLYPGFIIPSFLEPGLL